MKVYLSHHKVLIALEEDEAKWSAKHKAKASEIVEEAFNLIFLHVSDFVIHKVDGKETFLSFWKKN